MKKSKPNCFHCRHFYITHQPALPYGCHALGFKSKQLPSLVTLKNSGLECQLFTKKGQASPA